MKVAELDKMAKLTCLIRDTIANTFIKHWKFLSDLFAESGTNDLVFYGFAN